MRLFSRNNAGQAALEFLMTYGWAILIFIIAIGVLAYLGVLDPLMLVSERCSFPAGVECEDLQVSENQIILDLRNSGGRDMVVSRVSAASEALGSGDLGVGCGDINGVTIKSDAGARFILDTPDDASGAAIGCNFLDTGNSKNKYNLTLEYSWQDSPGIVHVMNGELLARKG